MGVLYQEWINNSQPYPEDLALGLCWQASTGTAATTYNTQTNAHRPPAGK